MLSFPLIYLFFLFVPLLLNPNHQSHYWKTKLPKNRIPWKQRNHPNVASIQWNNLQEKMRLNSTLLLYLFPILSNFPVFIKSFIVFRESGHLFKTTQTKTILTTNILSLIFIFSPALLWNNPSCCHLFLLFFF